MPTAVRSAYLDLAAVFGELRRNGLDVEDVSVRKKTLEDVFIALTGRRLRE